MKLILDLLEGKKTYIALFVLTLNQIFGINATEEGVNIVLTQTEVIINALALIAAYVSRALAKPKAK